jgi:hypothetical protein
MTTKQATQIQDKTIKDVIAYATSLSQKKITEVDKKNLLAKLAASYLPVAQAEAEKAEKKSRYLKASITQALQNSRISKATPKTII